MQHTTQSERGGLPLQCLPGTCVQSRGHGIELTLTELREFHPFREYGRQSVGVLIAPALPRTARVTEMDRHLR
jgi:hypothetical protein